MGFKKQPILALLQALTLAGAILAPATQNTSTYYFITDQGQKCGLVGDKFAICNSGLCCSSKASTYVFLQSAIHA